MVACDCFWGGTAGTVLVVLPVGPSGGALGSCDGWLGHCPGPAPVMACAVHKYAVGRSEPFSSGPWEFQLSDCRGFLHGSPPLSRGMSIYCQMQFVNSFFKKNQNIYKDRRQVLPKRKAQHLNHPLVADNTKRISPASPTGATGRNTFLPFSLQSIPAVASSGNDLQRLGLFPCVWLPTVFMELHCLCLWQPLDMSCDTVV